MSFKKGLFFTAVFAVLFSLTAVFLFTSFNEHNENKKLEIAYIAPISGEASSYWKDVEEGLLAGAEEASVSLIILSQDSVDERRQLANFDAAIKTRYDGIITMALNPESFTPFINRAELAGIPVGLLDGDAPNSKRFCFVGSNNYEAGILTAGLIDELTGRNARVGIVTAEITLRHITDRLDGIQDYFTKIESLQLVRIESSHVDETRAYMKAAGIIAEEHINVLFAAGAVDSGGVSKALREVVEDERDIIGIGFDDMPETLRAVEDGTLAACIAQSPYKMGRLSVLAISAYLRGDDSLKGIHYTPVSVVTRNNLRNYKDVEYED